MTNPTNDLKNFSELTTDEQKQTIKDAALHLIALNTTVTNLEIKEHLRKEDWFISQSEISDIMRLLSDKSKDSDSDIFEHYFVPGTNFRTYILNAQQLDVTGVVQDDEQDVTNSTKYNRVNIKPIDKDNIKKGDWIITDKYNVVTICYEGKESRDHARCAFAKETKIHYNDTRSTRQV